MMLCVKYGQKLFKNVILLLISCKTKFSCLDGNCFLKGLEITLGWLDGENVACSFRQPIQNNMSSFRPFHFLVIYFSKEITNLQLTNKLWNILFLFTSFISISCPLTFKYIDCQYHIEYSHSKCCTVKSYYS